MSSTRGSFALILTMLGYGMEDASCRQRQLVEEIRQKYCRFPEDDPEGLRRQWAEELESQGETARMALLRLAETKGDPDRWCGIWYLTGFKEARLIPLFRQIVSDDAEEEHVRVSAIVGLGLFHDGQSIDYVIPLLRSKNSRLVNAAVQYLALIDDERAREALRRAMVELDDFYLSNVAESLGIQRDRRAVSVLTGTALRGELRMKDQIRGKVAVALVQIGGVEAWRNAAAIARLVEMKDTVFCRFTIGTMRNELLQQKTEHRSAEELAVIDEVLTQIEQFPCDRTRW